MKKKPILLPEVVITAKKKKTIAKPDSIMVGGKKQSIADVSKALSKAKQSGTAKQYVSGIDTANPYKSTRQLASKSSASDIVNKLIEKKPKANLLAKKKK